MTTVTLKIIVDGQSYDFSDLVRTYESFDRACSEDFRHAVSTRSLTLVYTPQLLSLLSQSNVLVEIDVNGTRDFTGRLAPSSLQTRSYGAALSGADIEDLSVEFEDYSYRLEQQLTSTDNLVIENAVVCDASQPGKSCLHRLLNLAGLEVVNPPNIDTALLAFAPDPGQTILDVLDTLLYEYGYTFTFDPYGRVKVIKIIYDNPAPELTLTEHDIKAPLEIEKLYSEYDSVEVSYYPLKYKERVLLYMADLPFGDNGLRSGWPIQPGYLWPEEANVQETWFEYTDKAIGSKLDLKGNVVVNKDFTSIVMTKNHAVEEKTDPGVQKILQQFENKRCRLAYKNNSDYPKNIYYCNIIGDCIYRSSKVFACKNMVSDPCKKNSYESSYIHDGLAANRLCAFKAESLNGKCWKFIFKNDEELIPGTIIRIFDQYSGLDAISIITEKCYNITTNEYAYKSVGIKAPEIASILNTSVIIPEPISSNGIPAINTKTKKITISLYQENSLKPELPSNEINYTISTGQIEGLDNGWSIELQNAVRKPIWMTSYTTIIQLTQDEILISTDKWHEPVKIFVGTPIYLGMVSNIPESSTFSNNRIEGDWCLCTANGKFYKWTGTEWTDNNITTDNKMAALQDLLTIADASDTIAFCQTLVAIDVFAQNIAAKKAFIDTLEAQTLNINGTLKSGNLAANNAKVALQDLKGVKDIKFYGNGTNDLAIGQQGETPGVITVEIIEPYVGDVGYTGGKIFSYAPAREGSSVVLDNKILNYDEVITAVDNFVYGGRDDWRLPTISELQQLIQLNGNSMNEEYYWTSESFDNEHAYVVKKSTNTAEVFPKEIHRFVSGNEVYCSSNDCALIGNKIYTAHSISYTDIGNYLVIASYNIDTNEIICEATRSLSDSHFGTVGNIEYIDNKLYIFPKQSTYPYYNYNEYFVYDVVNKTFEKNYTVFYSQVCATEKDENNIYVATGDGDGITKSIYRFDTKNKTWNIYNNATGYSVYPNYHGMRIYNNKLFIFSQSGFDFNRFLVFDLNTEQLSTIYLPFNLGTYYAELIDNKIYAPDSNSNILLIVNCLDNSYTTVDITTNVASRMCCTHDNEYLYIFGKKNNDCYVEVIRLSDNQYMACKKLPYDAFKYIACLVNDTVIIPDYNVSQAYGGGYEIYKKNFLLNTWPVRVNTETRRFRYKLNDGSWINKDIITPNTQYLTDINIKVFWPQIMNHHTGDKWVITQTQMYSLSAKDINGVEYIKAYDGTLEVKTLKVTDGTINVTAVYAP